MKLVRAEGRLRFATMLWVLPVITQITLDPLLIFWARMGIRGAACGTVGGQAVSAGMSQWFFFGQRHRPYRIRYADLRPHGPTLRRLAAVGSPSLLAGLGAALLARWPTTCWSTPAERSRWAPGHCVSASVRS